MKRKDSIQQLKNKNAEDLKKDLGDLKNRLWSLNADIAAGKVKNVREMKEVKRTIARILTIARGKE